MIRAVAAHIQDDRNPPPPELLAVAQYEAFGILPEAGGARDQRAGELDRMMAARNVRDLWRTYVRRPKGWMKVLSDRQAISIIERVKGLLR